MGQPFDKWRYEILVLVHAVEDTAVWSRGGQQGFKNALVLHLYCALDMVEALDAYKNVQDCQHREALLSEKDYVCVRCNKVLWKEKELWS